MLLRECAHGIDLHVHLDGAVRPETLYELINSETLSKAPRSVLELREKLIPKAPYSLKGFLKAFDIIVPLISGKKVTLARICKEFVEDCVKLGGLCYVETRFCPFILTGPDFSAEEVLKTVLEALQIAGRQQKLEVRTILSIMRHMPETARETLELAKKYKPHGVVAIDIAGDDSVLEKQPTPNEIIQTFQEAKKLGIHRTVHVGENSSAKSVYEAVTTLHAERIGHGYHVLDNDAVYESVRNSGVHFELCPSSSFVTGAVDVKDPKKHPIHRFTQDAVNFSINTDDPTLTERWDLDEANYCINELGLKSSHLYDAKCNAAKAAFLSDDERIYLLAHINTRIGNRTIKV